MKKESIVCEKKLNKVLKKYKITTAMLIGYLTAALENDIDLGIYDTDAEKERDQKFIEDLNEISWEAYTKDNGKWGWF